MPPAELLVPFFVASAIFACVPGPGMFYAAAQTVASGRRSGWCAAVGFHLAGLGHIAAAAFGVSILLQTTPTLFIVMKVAGAGYLIWLGIRYLMRRTPLDSHSSVPKLQATKALKDSIVVEALNPKSALFYLAFLPQFTDASAGWPVWAQIVVLGIVVNAMFSVTDAILIEVSHAAMRRLGAHRARSSADRGRHSHRSGCAPRVRAAMNRPTSDVRQICIPAFGLMAT